MKTNLNEIQRLKEIAGISSSWDKLNKVAQDNFGEFGFATLELEDAGKLINLDLADKIAVRERGRSFFRLPEEDMKEIINSHPELLKNN